jgi:hypothetical protein
MVKGPFAVKEILRFFVPSSLRGKALVNCKFALTAAFLINILKLCCETFQTPASISIDPNAPGGPVAAFCVLKELPRRHGEETLCNHGFALTVRAFCHGFSWINTDI